MLSSEEQVFRITRNLFLKKMANFKLNSEVKFLHL